jgi:hypothetical protein
VALLLALGLVGALLVVRVFIYWMTFSWLLALLWTSQGSAAEHLMFPAIFQHHKRPVIMMSEQKTL